MPAGRLNTRITIQQLTAGQDAAGQLVQTWSDVDTVWADVRHPSGLQTVKSDADVSLVKASIRIRKRTGIDAGMRALVGGVAYDIKAVLQTADRKYLDLTSVRAE